MSLKGKGELRLEYDADIAVVDHWMNVQNVVLKGELVT